MWDLRNQQAPYKILTGHSFAVRRVRWSPHRADMLASVSYDMTCLLWSTVAPQPLINRFEHHSEFAVGLDFNLFIPGQLATGSWDGHCAVWSLNGQPPNKLMKPNGGQNPTQPPPQGVPGLNNR